MSAIIQFRSVRALSLGDRKALERLTTLYARAHETHEAPRLGCYYCLHNEPRGPRTLAAAA